MRHDQVRIAILRFRIDILGRSLRCLWRLNFCFENSALVGCARSQRGFRFGDFNAYAFMGSAGFAVDNIDNNLSVLCRLFNHGEVGNDSD